VKLIHNKKLLDNTGTTLWRVFQGLLLGGIPGLLLGLIMGWSHRLYTLINPFVAAGHPIPKIAILPLIMIIFGIGESSKVVVIALTAFFPLLINTTAGVQQISPIHFDVAKNYGANLTTIFTRVTFPGSLPLIMTGLRLSLNLALLVAIAVELVSAQEGLGAMIWLAWQTFRTEELYVSLAVTALLGIVFNFLLQRISLYLVLGRPNRRFEFVSAGSKTFKTHHDRQSSNHSPKCRFPFGSERVPYRSRSPIRCLGASNDGAQ